jgi:hypothetical protein
MTDRKQTEGATERNQDRGRDQLGFPDLSLPYLGDPEVVEGLVRQFLSDVVAARKGYNADELDAEQAQEKVKRSAKRHADIFMGRAVFEKPEDGFAVPPWNSPAQLGRYLVGKGLDPDEDEACESLFLLTANLVLDAMAEHEDDKIDDETAQFRTDVAVEQAVQMLLGLPDEMFE